MFKASDYSQLSSGGVVYTQTDKILRGFPDCQILITSESDIKVTDELFDRLPNSIRKWFAINNLSSNPRVVTIPLAMLPEHGGKIPFGDQQRFVHLDSQKNLSKERLLYVQHRIHTPERAELYKIYPFATKVDCQSRQEDSTPYYRGISTHRYVVCPEGTGPDTHRIWEALELRTVPIVKRSKAFCILEDMPCLIVDNWSDVTEELLTIKYNELYARFDTPAIQKLSFEYWKNLILKAIE